MKRSAAEQRGAEILPGFSPKPVSPQDFVVDGSPSSSDEPETHSPTTSPDEDQGPIVPSRPSNPPVATDVSVRNGIVSFGK